MKTLIKNANIIPMNVDTVLRGYSAVLIDDRIDAILDKAPEGEFDTVIDATGKYLIPSLCDCHIHWKREQTHFDMYMAWGVTAARVMYGRKDILALRDENRSDIPFLYVGSPIVDGPSTGVPGEPCIVRNATEGREAVRRFHAEGYSFIKVYSFLPYDAFVAIMEEAAKRGLDVCGHVPTSARQEAVISAGMLSIEHAKEVYQRNLSQMVMAGTYFCPTLVVQQVIDRYQGVGYTNADYDGKITDYTMATEVDAWRASHDEMMHHNFRLDRTFNQYVKDIGMFSQSGGKLLAGTDVGTAFLIPGISLHDELELLVSGGVSTYQALRSATVNAAEVMHRNSGAVMQGMTADLMLLSENPLDHIANTKKIESVWMRGRHLNRSALDGLLEKCRQRAEESKHASMIMK